MQNIESLMQLFRGEVLAASQSFYAWKSINNVASRDSAVHQGMNRTAISWNVITHSLQTTFLVTLGRIFDTDSGALTVSTFLRSCQTHIDDFSKASLEARKRKSGGPDIESWLPTYMSEAYEPRKEDFRNLSKAARPVRATYEQIYRPIRNMVVAHRDLTALDAAPLFALTKIGDIEQILLFLHRVERAVWELYMNGRKCDLKDIALDEERRVLADINSLLDRVRA